MSIPSATEPVPVFYLYGEPQRVVAEGFVHVESLDDRSRPSEWTIRSHVHRSLNHIILISEGGGSMEAEDRLVRFDAPSLLLVPAGIAHGFQWHEESRGHVTTIADSYLNDILERDGDLSPLFVRATAIGLKHEEAQRIGQFIIEMARELAWAGAGQRALVESCLMSVMVRALRCAHLEEGAAAAGGRRAALVARYRARIEQRFRLRETIEDHARALGVSQTALRLACAKVGGVGPAAMLDERTLLEARRLLLYSNLSVADIAYSIGIEDPAYFSRFFTRHIGQPPRDYRQARGRPVEEEE